MTSYLAASRFQSMRAMRVCRMQTRAEHPTMAALALTAGGGVGLTSTWFAARKKAEAVQYERLWSEPLRVAKSAESSTGHVQSVQAREEGSARSTVVG